MKAFVRCMFLLIIILAASCDNTEPELIQLVECVPGDGTYTLEQSVVLQCGTEDAEIYYTLDGSDPDNSSLKYTVPLVLGEIIPEYANQVSIRARAFRMDLGWGDMIYAILRVNYPNSVSNLVISPDSGTQNLGTEITITANPPDAMIHYTLDGSMPSSASNLYSGPLHIVQAGRVEVIAIAVKAGWNPSPWVCESYLVPLPPPAMVHVEGGSFMFNGTSTSVSSFEMDKFEVSQSHYYAVMGAALVPQFEPFIKEGNDYPVYYTSWFNAIEYCNRRSILEGYTPCYGYGQGGDTDPRNWPLGWDADDNNQNNISCNWYANGYRLPTEAEWVFAARGGNASHGWNYSGHQFIDPCGWYDKNSGHSVHVLGQKIPNELGIYDMTGNLNEWCWDAYAAKGRRKLFSFGKASKGDGRLIKGGSYYLDSLACTIDSKASLLPSYQNATSVGLRVIRRQ